MVWLNEKKDMLGRRGKKGSIRGESSKRDVMPLTTLKRICSFFIPHHRITKFVTISMLFGFSKLFCYCSTCAVCVQNFI